MSPVRARRSSRATSSSKRTESLCTELGLRDWDAPMSEMSGGMVRKRLLSPGPWLLEPSCCCSDEPTNHLDIWRRSRMAREAAPPVPGAFVLVTHDRWFLDAVCSSIMEIDRGRSTNIRVPLPTTFRRGSAHRDPREGRVEEAHHPQARARLAGSRARAAPRRARGAKTRSERCKRRPSSAKPDMGRLLHLGETARQEILVLQRVSKSYSSHVVLSPSSASFQGGRRLGIVRP